MYVRVGVHALVCAVGVRLRLQRERFAAAGHRSLRANQRWGWIFAGTLLHAATGGVLLRTARVAPLHPVTSRAQSPRPAGRRWLIGTGVRLIGTLR